IIDENSLSAEYERINNLLQQEQSNIHWKIRVASLQRLAEISSENVKKFANKPLELLIRNKDNLVSQLTDRRSAVVKVACLTLNTISNALFHALIKEPYILHPSELLVEQLKYRDLILFCMENVFPILNVTIKVISDAC